MVHRIIRSLPAGLMAAALILAPSFSFAKAKKAMKKSAPRENTSTAQAFNVYTEARDKDNHFIPSGWMGDTSDISYSDNETMQPHSGRTCIKMAYKAEGGSGWAGIFWQNPANNWGARPASGFDLSKFKKLVFWARGENGGEVLSEVKVGGIKGEYPDSDEVSTKNLILSDKWTKYSIDLTGGDFSYVIGGFCVVFAQNTNPSGAVVYLDDIAFVTK